MKKILALMLSFMLMLALAGCGDSPKEPISTTPEVSQPAETEEPDTLAVSSIMGKWECVDIEWVDNGSSRTTKDLEELFDTKAADFLQITATPDGKAQVVMSMGSSTTLPMLWTEENDSYILSVDMDAVRAEYSAEEANAIAEGADAYKLVATLADNQLTVVSDASYEDEGQKIESTITYTLEYKGMIESTVIKGWDNLFTNKQSRDMSNFMNDSYFLVIGDTLYADMDGEAFGKGSFSMAKLTTDGESVSVGKVKTLQEGLHTACLYEHDGYLYAVNENKDNEGIVRMKIGENKVETIYEGLANYMQIRDGRLYFTDKEHKFCSSNLEGKDVQTVMDKEVYYSYLTPDMKWLIYQDDADSETIHVYNMDTKEDVRLTEEPSYGPVIGGSYLFYYTEDGEGYRLNRLDLFTGVNERDDNFLYAGTEHYVEDGQLVVTSAAMLGMDFQAWNTFEDIRHDDNGYTRHAMYTNGSIHITEDAGDREIRIFNCPFVGSNRVESTKIGYR